MFICLHQWTPLEVAMENGHTGVAELLQVSAQDYTDMRLI